MRNFILNIIIWLCISLLIWLLVLFLAFNVQAEDFNDQVMDIPTKCEKKYEKAKILEHQLADRIFLIWVKEGSNEDPRQLYNKASFTAFWILIDNGIICRHPKYK